MVLLYRNIVVPTCTCTVHRSPKRQPRDRTKVYPVAYPSYPSPFFILKMRFILFALVSLPGAIADYLQTSFLPSTDCTGTVFSKFFSYTGICANVGDNVWGTLSCTNSTTAILNVYASAQCTGTPVLNPIPMQTTCSSGGSTTSTIQTCVSGTFSAPAGVIMNSYTK